MADIELKRQIDDILALINAAEKTLKEGGSVDLKPLEKQVSHLYESIASMRRNRGDMAREDLIMSLDSILDRLDRLEQQASTSQAGQNVSATDKK